MNIYYYSKSMYAIHVVSFNQWKLTTHIITHDLLLFASVSLLSKVNSELMRYFASSPRLGDMCMSRRLSNLACKNPVTQEHVAYGTVAT